MLPNGTMLVTAGGNEVKIWDLLSGGNRLLKTISAHNKTVTNLSLARDQTRLVTTSLDRQLKFHEISTFKTVHSLSLPSPILSAAVAVSLKFNSGMSVAGGRFWPRPSSLPPLPPIFRPCDIPAITLFITSHNNRAGQTGDARGGALPSPLFFAMIGVKSSPLNDL